MVRPMKKQIRSGLWETNSSSSHTVYLTSENMQEDISELNKYIQDDGYLHIKFGKFGWEIKNYTDAYTKLQYALTMVVETECRYRPIQTEGESIVFEETEGFKAIDSLIARVLDCAGVIVDSNMEVSIYEDYWNKGTTMIGITHDGYIDHQSSTDDYNSLQDFLDYYDISLETFIFDSNVVLHTDNDNY